MGLKLQDTSITRFDSTLSDLNFKDSNLIKKQDKRCDTWTYIVGLWLLVR